MKIIPNRRTPYRTTPHRMTGQTPAKLLLQRETRTKLPTKVRDTSRMDSEVRNKDSSEKAKAKEYTDTRHDTQSCSRRRSPGHPEKNNKYSTQFGKDPMKIIKINMVPNHIRGSSWFTT